MNNGPGSGSSSRAAEWLGDLPEELESALSETDSIWSLHQVPLKLRFQTSGKSLFTPNVVAIGPLHKDPRFAGMEKLKLRYMASFLKRKKGDDLQHTLNECAAKISELASQAQHCYKDILSPQGSGDIAKLLLVDGCFVLELIIRSYQADAQAISAELRYDIYHSAADANDPLLKKTWMTSVLRLDLALLENQIPFSILEGLFNVITSDEPGQRQDNFLAKMALSFFKPLQPKLYIQPTPVSGQVGQPCAHLLSLLWNNYNNAVVPVTMKVKSNGTDSSSYDERKLIPNASKLRDIGMVFEKKVSPEHFMHIEFDNGIFKMPRLYVTECTESLLSNLMAFECCLENRSQIIASYVALVSQLVQFPEDVVLLEAQGIIINGLGNGGGVCSMFHRLVTQNLPASSYFDYLSDKVNEDLKHRYSFQAKFKRGYMPTRAGNIRMKTFYTILIVVAVALLGCVAIPLNMISNSVYASTSFLLLLAYAFRKVYKLMRGMHIQFTTE